VIISAQISWFIEWRVKRGHPVHCLSTFSTNYSSDLKSV